MCYSDVPYLYSGRGFAAGYLPYTDNGGRYQAMEYPVLIGYFAYGASWVTQRSAARPTSAAPARRRRPDLRRTGRRRRSPVATSW